MSTDIDIDFYDRKQAFNGLRCVPAVQKDERRRSHASGLYFHDIPVDPIDGMAVWDHEEAAQKGYFKIDFLNNSIYHGVRDEMHLVALLVKEPPWEAFDDPAIVSGLAHVNGHFDVLRQIKPRCIEDLAVCLAMIRPAKRYLKGKSRDEVDREIWLPCEDMYYYKRSHAIAFAASIVVQLNLLIEQVQ